MRELGVINTEGGPLLLADLSSAQQWRGAENGGSDYQRACAPFDSDPSLEGTEVAIGRGRGLVWEMRGSGTATVFSVDASHLVVVRAWPARGDDATLSRLLAQLPDERPIDIGQLSVPTGILAVLWSVEDGSCLHSSDVKASRPSKGTAIDDSVLICPVEGYLFGCQHDCVETPRGVGRRLHLRRCCA